MNIFENIYVEKDIALHPRTQQILGALKKDPIYITSYRDIFEKVKRPYLQKRDALSLFLATKKGDLVKEAPNAYGVSGAPHFYYIHAYNCIYECNYCYLQGHFNSPDLVIFINHEDILQQMQLLCDDALKNQCREIWFHAGEFSDSLALSHLTAELPLYFQFFQNNPHALLELRTKSANTRELEKIPAQQNVIISFSLSPEEKIKTHDFKTAPLNSRLLAMKRLQILGHPLAIHLDPIIFDQHSFVEYQNLLAQIKESLDLSVIEYVSLGVVRFTKDVYRQVQVNYPEASFHSSELVKSFDGKIRYPRPIRKWLLRKIYDLCLQTGFGREQLYLCMEDENF